MIYIVIGIGIALLVFVSVLWKLAVKGQTPKRVINVQKPAQYYEEVSFQSGDAVVHGWYIPAKASDDEPKPLIIVVHGWASAKSRVMSYVDPLHQAGYSLLLFDARGHGDSEGIKAPTIKSFRDDVKAAVRYAQRREDVAPGRIGLLGHSFGGMGSLLASRDKIGIKALVTDSMPARFRTIMEALLREYKMPYAPLGPLLTRMMFMRAGISSTELREELSLPAALEHRKSPVLLVHSRKDRYIPSEELDYLMRGLKNRREDVECLYVDTDGHRSSEKDSRFWKNVLSFYQKYV
ncbi:alpha/beta hydrolase [Paenibacillus sp. 7541]|uniref:alpha/beta hydrolase n=1 Tax=Paenibacillus sp. 7541 TaxID=2026236 RepID=UPI000BA73C8F|nr:alpha/beta fold hydrolase [Paenibacillus sp. 7541]PAK55948.1 hypothetical protein CHH75_01440 [Paenibacillus sp. 7541]